jgi:hypothetical protein
MKNLFALLLLLTVTIGFSQENDKNSKWIIGFGANFIDNTSTMNNQYFNTSKQWNYVPTVSKISFEKSISKEFSIESAIAMNSISSKVYQNGTMIQTDAAYYGLDLNGKFFFDDYIVPQTNVDAFLVLGVGINSVDSVTNQTSNFGLGFNFWFQPNLGFRLQTVGKFGFDQKSLLNNHIQHSAELIFKF